jgi:murein DD-endopeptidase MepM/ murein hydrolase activator NlpD
MPVRTEIVAGAGGLLFPVPAVSPASMANSFADARGSRSHHAVDIMAPRNSEIIAVDDGVIAKLMVSAKGGLSIYEWNPDRTLVYFYAHLQAYAPGLEEGQTVRRGQVIGYVGTTGNAPPNTPHLHFAIAQVGDKDRWWGGVPVDPFPIWR